jgi:hypothetical protein
MDQNKRRKWSWNPTSADADHSSLLRRLLSGKPKLPKPPPLRFGYPDYELGEGKEIRIHEITSYDGKIIIDQCDQWKWSDKANGLLIHGPTGETYKLTAVPDIINYAARTLKKV